MLTGSTITDSGFSQLLRENYMQAREEFTILFAQSIGLVLGSLLAEFQSGGT